MKKLVTVTKTITYELEIDIDEKLLSDKGVELFKDYMWDIDDSDEIIEHVAYHVIEGNEGHSLDFVGLLGKEGVSYGGEEAQTKFKIIDSYEDHNYEHG